MNRSANMRAIRSKNMRPEMAVRRLVHRMGYRFRLHRSDLPGKPDLVFTSRHKIIFVHGCYWHGHSCKVAHTPKSNTEYWGPKLQRNRARDMKNLRSLRKQGWSPLVIWECELKNLEASATRIQRFLDHAGDVK